MMDLGKQADEQHIQHNYRLYGQFLQPEEMNTCREMTQMRMMERGFTVLHFLCLNSSPPPSQSYNRPSVYFFMVFMC